MAIENSSQFATGHAVHADDPIAKLQAGRLRDGVGLERADDDGLCLEGRHLRALVEHHGHNDEREHQVHHRAHDQNLETLPLRLRQKLVVRAGARVLGVFAGHLDVAAERDGADAVLGVSAAERSTAWGRTRARRSARGRRCGAPS